MCLFLMLVLVNFSLDLVVERWFLLLQCWVLLFLFVVGLWRIFVGDCWVGVGIC